MEETVTNKKKTGNGNTEYGADSIQVMKGLEAVRVRPAMYIGSTGTEGLHHLVYEVVDNAIDEALAGFCDRVDVVLHKNGTVSVQDNGRGIPVDTHKEEGRPAVEVIMTTLHAGGKFDSETYKVSGGLHGVGVSVVNALSSRLEVEVSRDGQKWFQCYERGKPEEELKTIGISAKNGTRILFAPDPEIFETTEFHFDRLSARFREHAFLNSGLTITILEESSGKSHKFLYKGGLSEYVTYLNENRVVLHKKPIHFTGERETGDGHFVEVEVAIQYNDGYSEIIYSFANNINTVDGGTHLSGFKAALTRTINGYAKKNNLLKAGKNSIQDISGDDAREGLTAIVSVKMTDPQFEGQTKAKLGNSDVKGLVEQIVGEHLGNFLEENPPIGRKLISKAVAAATARDAARKARALTRRKTALENSTLPGKLADCSMKNADDCEIFIVEGDSAGGTAKQGRDRRTQAILPIRGKILNVEKNRVDKILANKEVQAMVMAIGAGIAEDFDVSKIRYGKVIIMTDADVDGSHIRTLLMTFFFRQMVPLVEQGHLYIAAPPLFRVKKGKEELYAFSEEEKDRYVKKLTAGKKEARGIHVQRYKGLGEMNPDQLWETTMDPERRVMRRVRLEDGPEADNMFALLMGEVVEPRRKFIEENADRVQNLDA
ncbi:MAG: DNA topoisomerase (ATP-hydrolyzing) subunit B [Gemmatimonadota bacterium]|nr:DNA topoisomerase (ATP-hydrolyzing) subunit B [Gemmatimonadota bacterium]